MTSAPKMTAFENQAQWYPVLSCPHSPDSSRQGRLQPPHFWLHHAYPAAGPVPFLPEMRAFSSRTHSSAFSIFCAYMDFLVAFCCILITRIQICCIQDTAFDVLLRCQHSRCIRQTAFSCIFYTTHSTRSAFSYIHICILNFPHYGPTAFMNAVGP